MKECSLEFCPLRISPSALCVVSMPNGHREPRAGIEDYSSPIHTSDSEETYDNKVRWRGVAYKVLRQWLRYISIVRVQRLQAELCPHKTASRKACP